MAEYIEREAAIAETRKPRLTDAELRRRLASIPAADVEEVRHGRWMWDKNGMDWNLGAWKCSECHSKPETWWETIAENPYRYAGSHYCPNCGAKMDGGVNNAAD